MLFYCTGLKQHKNQTSSRNKIWNSLAVGPFQVLLIRKPKKYTFCCNICSRMSPAGKIALILCSVSLGFAVVLDHGDAVSWFYFWYFIFRPHTHDSHHFFSLHLWVVERRVRTPCKRDLCHRYGTLNVVYHCCCSYESILWLDIPFYYHPLHDTLLNGWKPGKALNWLLTWCLNQPLAISALWD